MDATKQNPSSLDQVISGLKAAAFPTLIGVIVFFGFRMVNQLDKIQEAQTKFFTEQALIDYRLTKVEAAVFYNQTQNHGQEEN